MPITVDIEYIKEFLLSLLKIPSPAGDTEEALDRAGKELQSLGLEIKRTNKRALIAVLPGKEDTPKRIVSAHIDTLGAVVRQIKSNGRLTLAPIGGFAWNSVEGENVSVKTGDGKTYTGTFLPEKASIHVFSDQVRTDERTDENTEVRLDEPVSTKEDTLALGIRTGDFVSFEPRPVFTPSGYLKSRYLDDKLCVALLAGVVRSLRESGLQPAYTTQLYISNYEEIGHGISVVSPDVNELLALDIAPVAPVQASSEHKVSICARDSHTPFDFGFRSRLARLASDAGIPFAVDVFTRYGSDASLVVKNGADVNFACIGPGVDATHHYERTHKDSIRHTAQLVGEYLLSP